MATVAFPKFTLTYEGKDISRALEPYLISMNFEDTVEGEASSLEIELDNSTMFFSNGWYPDKGAHVEATFGDMYCGAFTMDEIELKGPPDTAIWKSLSNVVTKKALKTKRSRAHENKTLAQIAQTCASANGLKIVGSVPNILIERVTQRKETDLKFLRRVSWDYGIIFSVRDEKLVFTSLVDLEKRKAAFTLDKTDLLSYSIKDKTDKTSKAAIVRSHNPTKKEVITGTSKINTLQNNDAVQYTQIVAADREVVHKKAENKQQAEAMADAHFYRANSWVQSGEFEAPGHDLAFAGNNIEITGLGVVGSGIYNMVKVSHTLTRESAWTFKSDIKRVAPVSAVKQRGKKSIQPSAAGLNDIVTLQNKDAVKFTQIVGDLRMVQ